jgi:hypothetical protein
MFIDEQRRSIHSTSASISFAVAESCSILRFEVDRFDGSGDRGTLFLDGGGKSFDAGTCPDRGPPGPVGAQGV